MLESVMLLGDDVLWRGRVYTLAGVDPVSVRPAYAYLADAKTGERLRVPLRSVKPAPSPLRGRAA